MTGRSRRRQRERGSYAQGAAFGLLTVATVAIISIASSVVTARLYGVEIIGSFALAIAPTAIVGALSTMQEQAALSRELSTLQPRAPRVTGMFVAVQLFSTALTLVVASLTTAAVVLLYHGPIGQPDLIAPALVLLAGYLVFDNTSWNIDVIFAAFRAGRELFICRLIVAIVFVAMAVAMSFGSDDVWALVYAQLGASGVGLLLRMVFIPSYMRFRVPGHELRRGMGDLRAIAAFGVKLAPAFTAEGVAHEAGTWILGATTSLAGVGAWNRAWMLGRRLLEPGYRVGEVLFPTLVQHHNSANHWAFDRTLMDSARYAAAGLLLPASVVAGAAVGIMEVFGPGFGEAATALSILAIVPVLYAVTNSMLLAQTAVGLPWAASRITLVRAAIMIGAGAALSFPFGVTGMAVGYVLGYAVDTALRAIATRPLLETSMRVLWPPRCAVALVLAYAGAVVVGRALDEALPGVLGTLVAMAAAGVQYLALVVALDGLTDADRARLERVRTRIPGLRGRVASAA